MADRLVLATMPILDGRPALRSPAQGQFERRTLYINKAISRSALAGLYRMARIGLVTPLRDGMNLVAKEYVAAQAPDNPGVLVLSQFAGAAQELKSALIVNPYDIEATAAAIARAYAMPLEERKDRWNALMAVLRANSIHDWTAHFLHALGNKHEGKEIDDSLIENARPAATAGLSRTAPGRARLDGLAALCDLAGVAVPGAYFLAKS